MHIDVIGKVIAKVGHGRWIDGGEPDRVNAEPTHVIQLAGDAREISYSISIAIEKTARVDLINHPRLPPVMCVRHTFLLLPVVALYSPPKLQNVHPSVFPPHVSR